MVVAIPTPYGKATWTDYTDYWRKLDAEYLQARSVLRFADSGSGGTGRGSATGLTAGQVTYLTNPDRLEYFSSASKWVPVLGAENLKASPINNTGGPSAADEAVTISQISSTGGKGLIIGKDLTSVSTDTDLNGVLKVIGTGSAGHVDIQTGTQKVKFTTDAIGLVLDQPISTIPSISAGAIGVTGTMNATTVTATAAMSGTSVTASGALSGNTLSVTTSATIAINTTIAGGVVTSTHHQSSNGRFTGTATAAKLFYNSGGTNGASSLEVENTNIRLVATGDFTVEGQTKILESKGIIYYNGASYSVPGTVLGYGGPVVYSTTALTAANYPPGTIWVS